MKQANEAGAKWPSPKEMDRAILLQLDEVIQDWNGMLTTSDQHARKNGMSFSARTGAVDIQDVPLGDWLARFMLFLHVSNSFYIPVAKPWEKEQQVRGHYHPRFTNRLVGDRLYDKLTLQPYQTV